jgi:hypothetical protein
MNKQLARFGSRVEIFCILALFNVVTVAQTQGSSLPENTSALATARAQQSGVMTITDRYGKQTRIVVQISSFANSMVRAYTSGDRIDADSQVTAVRMGEHIGVVTAGRLWKFPLKSNDAGAAEVEFDGVGIFTRVSWRVTMQSNERTVLEADVIIPVSANGYSPQLARLTGLWKADFDSTFPIPIRSELTARLNVRPAGNEFTVIDWVSSP